MIYIILFLFLFFLAFSEVFLEVKNKELKKGTSLFLLIFVVMIGIREGVGVDYYAYSDIFQGINEFNDYNYLEPGFRVLIIMTKFFGGNFHLFSFFFGCLSILFLYKALENDLYKNKGLALVILYSVFLINYNFNGIRQGLVMSIFLYSLTYFSDEKYVNWKEILVLSAIATTIHSSGISIAIAYLIRNVRIRTKYKYIVIFISLSFFVFNPFDVLLSSISSTYSVYIENFPDSIDVIGILQRTILMLFITYSMSDLIKNSKNSTYDKLYTVYLSGFAIYFVLGSSAMLATRVNMGLRILEIILIPAILYYEKEKKKKIIIFAFVIIWCAFVFYSILVSPTILPYNTIFTN